MDVITQVPEVAQKPQTLKVADPDYFGVYYEIPAGWTPAFNDDPGRAIGAGFIYNGEQVLPISSFTKLTFMSRYMQFGSEQELQHAFANELAVANQAKINGEMTGTAFAVMVDELGSAYMTYKTTQFPG